MPKLPEGTLIHSYSPPYGINHRGGFADIPLNVVNSVNIDGLGGSGTEWDDAVQNWKMPGRSLLSKKGANRTLNRLLVLWGESLNRQNSDGLAVDEFREHIPPETTAAAWMSAISDISESHTDSMMVAWINTNTVRLHPFPQSPESKALLRKLASENWVLAPEIFIAEQDGIWTDQLIRTLYSDWLGPWEDLVPGIISKTVIGLNLVNQTPEFIKRQLNVCSQHELCRHSLGLALYKPIAMHDDQLKILNTYISEYINIII